ncbi:MAG: hypothetical protein HY290_27065 [Planctomycetia bacterium]|nr:hypothetical protein [Planctomycetia bacterium]
MTPDCCKLICRAACILFCAAICAGCSAEQNKAAKDRYVPPADLARRAVEEVLVDWREGRLPAPINRMAVGIQVVDKQRNKGQTLADFEILGEAPSEAARCFAVRIRLKGPDTEEKVRFVVIGIDPLWVFRQEDYELISQWACGKPEEEAAGAVAENPPPGEQPAAQVEQPGVAEETGPRQIE